ncbi:MAG: prepilin-type N-terminal cleavage/methylation domain-containing protein [Planctomycetota bacterium]|nr:prepilin-type N-terminal cleavage/methylation domain-containing protein [Planctomycetota bacterium]
MNAPRRPRGFTVVELLLALMLSALVIAGSMSLFGVMLQSDKQLSVEFEDAGELAATQQIVRRAMRSLVAAAPVKPAPAQLTEPDDKQAEEAGGAAEQQSADEKEAAAAQAQSEAQSELTDLIASVTGDAELARELASSQSDRPNFELYFDASSAGGLVLPALEVKLMESPIPGGRVDGDETTLKAEQFLPVRGVFETVPEPDVGTLMLCWRSLEPPGPRVTLVRNLTRVEWFVLPRRRHGDQWVDVYAAYLKEYYPIAVRLVLWTADGGYADWLFDAAASEPGQ